MNETGSGTPASESGRTAFVGATRFARLATEVLPMRYAFLSLLIPAGYLALASAGFIAESFTDGATEYRTGLDLITSNDWKARLIFVFTIGTPACGLLLGVAGLLRAKLSRVTFAVLAFPPMFALMSTSAFLIASWSVAGWGLRLQPLLAAAFLGFLYAMRNDLQRVKVLRQPSPANPDSDTQRLWKVAPTALNDAADALELLATDAPADHGKTIDPR